MEPAVRLTPPPAAVVRAVNPGLRRLLRSPVAGFLPAPLAVLELTGRRSGRRLAVPVGLHDVGEAGPVVFTEGAWRHNFAGGRDVVVSRGAQRRSATGLLEEDPEAVARALGVAVQRYGARSLAMTAAKGRQVRHEDLLRLGRGMVRLTG